MMNKATMARIAASSMLLGVTMVGCKTSADGSHPGFASDVRVDKNAVRSAAAATKALAKNDVATAIAQAENAVALSPRDAGYRALLGRSYLAGGRFQSAATSFGDALQLDSSQGGAALSLALAQTALGKWDEARATVAKYEPVIAPGDRGLAIALAGDPAGGVTLLEATVRGGGSDAKVRQNLALSYALAGRWNEAKGMASYDLPAGEVDKRIMQWSSFARPEAASDQVASLLGVTPAVDAGQPARLALNGSPEQAVAVAVAAPPPPERIVEEVAVADVIGAPVSTPAPQVAATAPATPFAAFAGVTFASRAEIVQPLPQKAEIAGRVVDAPLIRAASFAPKKRLQPVVSPLLKRASLVRPIEGGRYVVQLGAFSQSSRVETAWNSSIGRFGTLADFAPSSGTYVSKTGTAALYRLSIAGFETRGAANDVCLRIRSAGGACFVRVAAGDAPTQWASRTPAGPRLAAR